MRCNMPRGMFGTVGAKKRCGKRLQSSVIVQSSAKQGAIISIRSSIGLACFQGMVHPRTHSKMLPM